MEEMKYEPKKEVPFNVFKLDEKSPTDLQAVKEL